ncbi:type II secretion system protein GspJ [Sphingomonas sp.]
MTARSQGFTLIELMISLGLFALIAVAGLALVDSILGVQSRTATRLDALGSVQRASFVVASDLEQVAAGDMESDGASLSFTRVAPGLGGAPVPVRYSASGGVVLRQLGGAPQRLLEGAGGLRFRFINADGNWVDRWPVAAEETPPWPRAVEMRADIEGRGEWRRVVTLPARPVTPAS